VGIRVQRLPDSQYGTTLCEVPVSLVDESLGTVRLYLRELPALLAQELDTQFAASTDKIPTLREYARWGVAGHEASDFVEELHYGEMASIPYKSQEVEYADRCWRVASDDTVSLYQHALPQALLLYSIRAALAYYHGGIVPTARLLWDSTKPKKEAASMAPPLDRAT
jgi:hypothetical protein